MPAVSKAEIQQAVAAKIGRGRGSFDEINCGIPTICILVGAIATGVFELTTPWIAPLRDKVLRHTLLSNSLSTSSVFGISAHVRVYLRTF